MVQDTMKFASHQGQKSHVINLSIWLFFLKGMYDEGFLAKKLMQNLFYFRKYRQFYILCNIKLNNQVLRGNSCKASFFFKLMDELDNNDL